MIANVAFRSRNLPTSAEKLARKMAELADIETF
jgi:hypothetical protein